MTPDQAKDVVKFHCQYACAKKCGDWRIVDAFDEENVIGLSKRCRTEGEAWINAAERIIAKQKDRSK